VNERADAVVLGFVDQPRHIERRGRKRRKHGPDGRGRLPPAGH
jgi:hypothetical protein